jgi:hypothetical protein
MRTPRTALITGTLDNADIIEETLRYHVGLGVDAIFVTDCGSVDGTWELLTSQRWQGLVRAVRRPSAQLSAYDISTEAVMRVSSDVGAHWALISDPDEFWVSDRGDLREALAEAADDGINLITAQRHNMTGVRVAGLLDGAVRDFLSHNRICVREPHTRSREETETGRLSSPFIFSAIGPKTIVQPGLVTRMADGDHDAALRVDKVSCTAGFRVLHIPIRSYERFEQKVRNARADIAANPQWPPSYAWHWRRWVRLLDRGELHDEYLHQFLSPADRDRFLEQGVVTVENAVAERLRAFGDAPVEPVASHRGDWR